MRSRSFLSAFLVAVAASFAATAIALAPGGNGSHMHESWQAPDLRELETWLQRSKEQAAPDANVLERPSSNRLKAGALV